MIHCIDILNHSIFCTEMRALFFYLRGNHDFHSNIHVLCTKIPFNFPLPFEGEVNKKNMANEMLLKGNRQETLLLLVHFFHLQFICLFVSDTFLVSIFSTRTCKINAIYLAYFPFFTVPPSSSFPFSSTLLTAYASF